MANRTPTIHVWVPDILATGGIQHYSRAVIRALLEIKPGYRIRVHSKNDGGKGELTGGYELPVDKVAISSSGRWPAKFRTAAFALAGLWYAWKERPEWILATHPHFSKALRLIKRLLGIRYIAVCHGIETWGKVEGNLKLGLEEAARVIPVSDFTKQHLVTQANLEMGRIRIVPNTFDEALFHPAPKPASLLERYGLADNQPVLLTVGRIATSERYKGHDEVICALPTILQSRPELRYIIVGDGDDRPRLEQLATKLGVAHATLFAGHVPRAELPLHYLLADAFVMPSTGEGFGIVFLESLASGRPVVAARSTASPEALDGGRLGELVEPGHPEQIAESVLKILDLTQRPELHNASWLHSEVVRLFGFESFKTSLTRALAGL